MKGHLRQRGKRSWELKYDLGIDRRTGKRRTVYHSFRGTKREAETELHKLITEAKDGRRVKPSKLTLARYLDQWLESVRSSVSLKTYEWFEYIVHKNLVPGLGEIPLKDLEPIDIQTFYTRLLDSGRHDGKGGLSRRTTRHCARVLRQSLQQAVTWGMLARNPASREFVKPPKLERCEIKALDPEQIGALLKEAKPTHWYMPFLLCVTTGLRRGEMLGLRWQDVDLDRGSLTVNQSLEQTGSGIRFKAPKTKSSQRQITLPNLTIKALREHKIAQMEQRMLLGLGRAVLVFTNPDGRPIKPNRCTEAFTATAKRTGLSCTLHVLRHSHASQLLRDGVPVTAVAQRLGHSNSATTLSIYAHMLPGMEQLAAAQTDAALKKALDF